MFRSFFSAHNPLFYPLLLIAVVALRWRGADPLTIDAHEALLLELGRRIAGGERLYADLAVTDMPLLPLLFAGAHALAGPAGAVLLLRGLEVLIVVASAALLNAVVERFRVVTEAPTLPGFWLALLLCLPPGRLALSPELAALLPLLLLTRSMLAHLDRSGSRATTLLALGGLAATAVLFDARAALIALPLLIASTTVRQPTATELSSVIAGTAIPFLALTGLAWGVGALEPAGHSMGTMAWTLWRTPPAELGLPSANDGPLVAATAGLILLLALLGLLGVGQRQGGNAARTRVAELLLAVWFVAGLLLLLVEGAQLRLASVALLTPPMAFFAAIALLHQVPARLRIGTWALSLALLIAPLAAPLWLRLPASWTSRWPLAQYLPPPTLELPPTLLEWAQHDSAQTRLWVLDAQPQLYAALQKPSTTPHLQFDRYLIELDRGLALDPRVGIPSPEVEDFFRLLRDTPPTLILAQPDQLEHLDRAFPLLLAPYARIRIGPWVACRRAAPQAINPSPSPSGK